MFAGDPPLNSEKQTKFEKKKTESRRVQAHTRGFRRSKSGKKKDISFLKKRFSLILRDCPGNYRWSQATVEILVKFAIQQPTPWGKQHICPETELGRKRKREFGGRNPGREASSSGRKSLGVSPT